MSRPRHEAELHRVGERGDLRVPKSILEQAGIEAKMHVRFRIDGKRIVIEKATTGQDLLDGPIGKKPDRDLFGKIHEEQAERKRRQLEAFGDKVSEAADDDTPPDHPFRES